MKYSDYFMPLARVHNSLSSTGNFPRINFEIILEITNLSYSQSSAKQSIFRILNFILTSLSGTGFGGDPKGVTAHA